MATPRSLQWIETRLAEVSDQDLLRRRRVRAGGQGPRIELEGREVINFGSNDYLRLAADPRLGQAVAAALADAGWGAGASPLITGYADWHARLEQRLAAFEGTEAALLFPSGFAANAGAVAALAGPGDTIFTDRKNHASLWDGCRLSRADVRTYPHLDLPRLTELLERPTSGRRLIVSDTLFSMDGDGAPLGELVDLAERFDAMLLLDEAHATGVFGAHGRGLAEAAGVEDRVAVRVGTLSKALGCHGGFVAGSATLIEWLVQRARPYVFSTAAPAAMAAAALAAVDIVEHEPQRRQQLLAAAAHLRQRLVEHGWDIGRSTSQIIPIMLGQPARALELSQRLLEQGLYVPAIRPPTVPEGEACLRISLTAGHTAEMVERLVAALRK